DGLRQCARLDPVRDRARLYRAAVQTCRSLGLLRRRAALDPPRRVSSAELEQGARRRGLAVPLPARYARSALRHALLIGFGLVMLTPLVWMISTSLKPDGMEFEYPPR